jgi:hypothetical protein
MFFFFFFFSCGLGKNRFSIQLLADGTTPICKKEMTLLVVSRVKSDLKKM